MDIFPIIHGQKADPEKAANHRHTKAPEPPSAVEPEVAPMEGEKKEQPQDDLIDFGQSDEPAKTTIEKRPSEIESLLSETGKPAQGPLLDFTHDLKGKLPPGGR